VQPPTPSPVQQNAATAATAAEKSQEKLAADIAKPAGTTQLWNRAKGLHDVKGIGTVSELEGLGYTPKDVESMNAPTTKIGRIGQIGKEIGAGLLRGVDIAGGIAAPRIVGQIPGTDLNRRENIARDQAAVTTGLENQVKAAGAMKDIAEADKADQGPTDKYEYKDVTDTRQTLPDGTPNPNYGKTVVAGVNKGDPTDVQFTGQQAAGAPKAAAEPMTQPEIDAANKGFADRYAVLNQGQIPPHYQLSANATKADYDRVHGMLQQVEQAKGTKAQQDRIEQDKAQAAEDRKNAAHDKLTEARGKAFDKDYKVPGDKIEQSYQMFENAYANKDNAKTGAESMLALSTHLATTFGNVKGSRVTKDMIQHHLGARSVSDSALVAVQRLTNGDVLSPQQWDAFHQLISESRHLTWDTAVREADRKGLVKDFLPDGLTAMKNGKDHVVIDSDKVGDFQKKYPKSEVLQ